MKRTSLSVLVPPLAVCHYGCAGCCAAPIGVMWITGIISVVYGLFGGPAGMDEISWTTVSLGAVLWVIAAIWARTVIRGVDADKSDPKCKTNTSTVCRIVKDDDDSDPMSDIKNLTH